MGAMRREMDRDFHSVSMSDTLRHSGMSSTMSPKMESNSSSSYESKSYSSSSSQVDGGVPRHTSHSDSVYKSTRTGPTNIPHTSYSHSSSSFDSDRPYRNNVSSFSYNI